MGSHTLPPLGTSHTMTLPSTLYLCILGASLAAAYDTEEVLLDYDEASDPRLFFSNFTSGLVAINTTLLTYGAILVLGGAAIGLLLYLLSTSSPNSHYVNAYSNPYGSHSRYRGFSSRMGTDSQSGFNFDLLGLVSKALEVYQQLTERKTEIWLEEEMFCCHPVRR